MIISRQFSLAAAAALNPNNLWSGSAFEYLRGPSFANFGVVTTTTHALSGVLGAFFIGGNLVAEEFTIPNVDPAIFGLNAAQLANNFYIQAAGAGNDRLVTTLRNPTAGTVAGNGIVQIVPSGRR